MSLTALVEKNVSGFEMGIEGKTCESHSMLRILRILFNEKLKYSNNFIMPYVIQDVYCF